TMVARVFAGLFGVFLGLSLLKFGNPQIFEQWVTPPTNFYEWLLGFPWPISWAYWMLAIVSLVGVFCLRFPLASQQAGLREGAAGRKLPDKKVSKSSAIIKCLAALPLLWLAWQWIATTQSVDANLSRATLPHFVACVVCFYLGFFCLSRAPDLRLFLALLLAGLTLVLASG